MTIPVCSTMGHEDVPPVGEAFIDDEEPGTWCPYCGECLEILVDYRIRRYSNLERVDQLVRHIEEVLMLNGQRLREMHHKHVVLDANARHFIAELAVNEFLAMLAAEDRTL